jgi:hypothetical protein
VEESRILRSLEERMPAGLLTRAVAELDPLPEIRGPEPDVAPPEKGIVSTRTCARPPAEPCG